VAVTKEQKLLYNQKIRIYKSTLDDLKKEISTVRGAGKKRPDLEPYFLVKCAILGIQAANTMVAMSQLSMEIQNLKQDGVLNDARKEISSRISDLTRIVGEDIDGSLTENREGLLKLSAMTPPQKLHLEKAFSESIGEIKETMGNSKWRWYFPDLHYKLVVLTRNLFDFKEFDRIKDPNHEYYRVYQENLRFLIDETRTAAQEYRSKYELSTKEVSDLLFIRRLFEMEKMIHILTGQRDELEKCSTALDSINEKIESIMAEKSGGAKKKKK